MGLPEWANMAVLGLNAEGSAHNESAFNVGDLGSILGLGRFPGGGRGNPLQYCPENPTDRGVHGVAKSQT